MQLNSYLGVSLLVLGSVCLSIVGLLIARKSLNFEKLKPSHDVGGYLFSVIGALYSVLLGLVVVDAMQSYQRAAEITIQESNNLADVYILAQRLPEPRRGQIRKACVDYAARVTDVEWNEMKCQSYCPVAKDLAIGLMESLVDFEPQTDNEKALYPEMVSEAREFWQHRQSRINIADRGVPAAEWYALVIGAVVIVFFSFLFGIESFWIQLVMTSLVSLLISINLGLILLFATPFQGDQSIRPDSFEIVKYIQNHASEGKSEPGN